MLCESKSFLMKLDTLQSESTRRRKKKVYYGLWLSENNLDAWHDFLNEINQNECRMSQQKLLLVKCFCNIIFKFN